MKSVVIVIPAHNESAVIDHAVAETLVACRTLLDTYRWRIVIAENGSSDDTHERSLALAKLHPEVSVLRSASAGKGAAVIGAWRAATDDLLVFTDADLSADLAALPKMLAELESGVGLVVGSRVVTGARVKRTLMRGIGSRVYATLAQTTLNVPVRDWQCGFKGMTREAAARILPQVRSCEWFFDTELIALAHAAGIKVVEVPVDWVDARIQTRRSTLPTARIFVRFMSELISLRRRLQDESSPDHQAPARR